MAGFEGTGNSLSADVDVPTAGAYRFDTRYANAVAGDGQHVTRTLSLSVDGGASRTVSLPVTADWDTWSVASVPLQLAAGRRHGHPGRARPRIRATSTSTASRS